MVLKVMLELRRLRAKEQSESKCEFGKKAISNS